MFKLIKNEYKKIFRKKTIYIMILLIIGFTLFDLWMTKKYMGDDYDMHMPIFANTEEEIKDAEDNRLNGKAFDLWIEAKDYQEKEKLVERFKDEKWKIQEFVFTTMVNPVQEIITQKIEIEAQIKKAELNGRKEEATILKGSREYKDILARYKTILEDMDKISQKEYLDFSITETEKIIKDIKAEIAELDKKIKEAKSDSEEAVVLSETKEKKEKLELKEAEIILEALNLRKEHNIDYSQEYLNRAVDEYRKNKIILNNRDHAKGSDRTGQINPFRDSEEEYNRIKENMLIDKHVIETKQDVITRGTAYDVLVNDAAGLKTLILIISIYIAGAIVAEEFNKGTIKNLLIKPHSRIKILTAKLITVITLIIFTSIFLIFIKTIMTGLMLGFDTLKYDALVYRNDIVETYSVGKFLLYNYLLQLPEILMVTIFAFAVSTIAMNTAAAITLGILSLTGLQIVNQILQMIYSVKKFLWVKYIPTINWDWTYMFIPKMNTVGLMPVYSIMITIACMLILIIPSYIVFKRKNIKNI